MAKKASAETPAATSVTRAYQVLARTYRPRDFSELKGQDALVRTLTNAIQSGRIAHAFMLTGVRGVGKTTTARIIARALNCEKGPTVTPCGVCEQCRSITEDRNIDVIEMDAASNTGVDDMRAVIDSVPYAPAAARYKIYIFDEVHMLSKSAFNALLKTLEEPPAHVKFVFATTEIRKVPVTILSRCQRFDLRRINQNVLEAYFADLLVRENVTAEKSALALIARAADGSARDGLSLLDQAIARENGRITEGGIRDMLGLADRAATLDLFTDIIKGDAPAALARLDNLHASGAEPSTLVQDLLDITNLLTKMKVAPETLANLALPEDERTRGVALAQGLPLPVLARAWQMLLKGAYEVQHAPHPRAALEMLVIRLIYVADQPSPGDLVKQLKDGATSAPPSMPSGPPPGGGRGGSPLARAHPLHETVAEALDVGAAHAAPKSFDAVAALFGAEREAILQSQIKNFVHLVKFEEGHIALRLKDGAPANLTGQMTAKLNSWTGRRWVISLSRDEGAPTLAETEKTQRQSVENDVRAHPAVAETLRLFPGAKIVSIRDKE